MDQELTMVVSWLGEAMFIELVILYVPIAFIVFLCRVEFSTVEWHQ